MTLFLDQIIQYFALLKEKLPEKFQLLARWQVDLSIGVKNTSQLIVFVVNVLTIILFCFIFFNSQCCLCDAWAKLLSSNLWSNLHFVTV